MKSISTLLIGFLISTVHLSAVNAADLPKHQVKDINEFNLSQYKGKVIYLDFWASWCKPCQKSFPWMNELQKKHPADQFEVVTINLDRKSSDMDVFLKNVPAEFTVYHDPSGNVAQQFKLPGMPTSFIIDKQGKVIKKHVGFYDKLKPEIENEIQSQL